MSTLNLENIKHPDSASNNISVDSSGNTIANGKLGVGTNAPVKGVEVQSSSSENDRTLRLAYDGTYYADIAQLGAGGVAYRAFGGLQHRFETGGTERMQIDSAGRVTMPYQPYVFTRKEDTPTVTAVHPIVFNNNVVNVGNHYNNANGFFTAPVAGKYKILVMGHCQTQNNTQRELYIRVNSSRYLYSYMKNANERGKVFINGIIDLNANDTLSVELATGDVWGGNNGGINLEIQLLG